MFASTDREIDDSPADRRAVGLIAEGTGHVDVTEAPIDYVNFVWGFLSRDLATCTEERFSAVEAAVSAATRRLTGNLAPFVQERVEELMVLIVDWRWVSWAAAEEAAGRNPYATA